MRKKINTQKSLYLKNFSGRPKKMTHKQRNNKMTDKKYKGRQTSEDTLVKQLTGIVGNLYFAQTGERLDQERVQAGVEGMVALYDLIQNSQYSTELFYQGMALFIPPTAYNQLGIDEFRVNELLSEMLGNYFSSQKYNPNSPGFKDADKKPIPEHAAPKRSNLRIKT